MKKRAVISLLFSVSAAAATPAVTPPSYAAPQLAAPVPAAQLVPDVEQLLDQLNTDERTKKRQLEDLGKEAALAHRRTLARGRAYARLARAGMMPVGGGLEALLSHAERLERLRRAVGRDLDTEKRIAARRIQLGKDLDSIRAKRGPLEVQQRATEAARVALLSAQDRALAFQRAFGGVSTGAHTAVYGPGFGPQDPAESASGFAANKGRLPFPLPGRAEIHSAHRPGTDGPGLEMRVPLGSPVRAVFAGRVAFADSYGTYGKTVILDHGSRHYTVSANLGEISVKVGDDVGSGGRVGTVGDSGDGPLLYFEIRVGSETVDPAQWFGL